MTTGWNALRRDEERMRALRRIAAFEDEGMGLCAMLGRPESGRDTPPGASVIYFASPCFSDGPRKIGHTRDPEQRRASLQLARPDKIGLAGLFIGSRDDERFLHALFAPHRIRGEWFEDCPLIDAFLCAAASLGNFTMPWIRGQFDGLGKPGARE